MSNPKTEKKIGPWAIYGKNLGKAIPMLALFLSACLLALGLSLLSSLTLFLTIPFLVMPMFFVLEVSFLAISDGYENLDWGSGLSVFPFYFRPPFVGSYRVIRNFLLSLLVYFGTLFVTSLIYVAIASNLNGPFQEAVKEISQMMMDGNVEGVVTFTAENEALRFYSFLTSAIAFGMSLLFFSTQIGLYSFLLNFFYSFFAQTLNLSKGFFLKAYRENRGQFHGRLWKGTFWVYLLGMVGYGLGVFFAYRFASLPLAPTLGLLGFVLLLTPFLPYCFAYGRLLANEMSPVLMERLLDEAKHTLALYRQQAVANEEEIQEMEEGIRQLSSSIEKMEEEKKEGGEEPPKED